MPYTETSREDRGDYFWVTWEIPETGSAGAGREYKAGSTGANEEALTASLDAAIAALAPAAFDALTANQQARLLRRVLRNVLRVHRGDFSEAPE